MDSYCVIRANGFLIPDLFVDLINGKYLSCVLYQKQEDIVFNRSQLNRISINCNFFVIIIDLKTATLVDLSFRLLVHVSKLCITAQLGFNSCNQFQRVEWLCNVIICTNIKS